MMKKLGLGLLLLIAVLAVIYFLGPKPAPPNVADIKINEYPKDLTILDSTIQADELSVKGLKADNQARIIWADSSTKAKTKIVFLYIHGFSASQEEGDPVASNVAKKYGANLYLARVAEHGIYVGDSTLLHFTAAKAMESVENALAIAKNLGDEVHIMATSFGGALSLYLASKHPEIKSLVLYSPCIKTFDPTGELLDNPWGLQIARQVKKGLFNEITPKNEMQPKYWSMHYRLEALVELQNFMTTYMQAETFKKVACPVFLGYYYKNEKEQDQVVSVPALLEMYENLGSKTKEKMAFPNANNHVLASYVLSEDVKTVQEKTIEFLDKNINK
jgi:esterase/lipase